MYADDLQLLSPSIIGLQRILDTFSLYGTTHNIMFNKSKTSSAAIGRMCNQNILDVCMDNQPIPYGLIVLNRICASDSHLYVDFSAEIIFYKLFYIKYLGVTIDASCFLNVNVVSIKRKFYASLNSLLVRCSSVAEPVKAHLIKSYCLPLITYCIGALEYSCYKVS